ncbi:MAG TPA: cupredoxin domain-containing protein [Chloroflexota bacterium]
MIKRWIALARAALTASVLLALPASVAAQPAPVPGAPKAYIGLFKDNAVAVLDTASNKLMKTIPIPTGPHGLVVTPDGRWVFASSDGDSVVSVIDTVTDSVADAIQVGATPHGLAITPDGSRVLVAGFGTDSVEAIDTASHQVVWQAPVPQPHNIAITADGQTAYVAAQKEGEQQLAIIDISTGVEAGSMALDHTPRALNLTPDGADIAYTLAGVDALQVRDLASQQLDAQVPTGASPHHPLFTPDGKLGLVVSQGPGTLDLFDPSAYTALGTVKVGAMPHWIGVSADSRWAYVTNESSNDVSVVDLSDRSVKATVAVGNAPRKIVIQPGAASTAAQAGGISIAGFAFRPPTTTISAGQSVTITNADAVAHTSTSGAWDSGEIQPGASYVLSPTQPGTYAYHCSIHPFMTATLVVQ